MAGTFVVYVVALLVWWSEGPTGKGERRLETVLLGTLLTILFGGTIQFLRCLSASLETIDPNDPKCDI